MATWTDAEIATLKAAVASGLLTVIYDGPPRRQVTYQSLDAMRALLAEMTRQESAGPPYRYVQYSKGFRRGD